MTIDTGTAFDILWTVMGSGLLATVVAFLRWQFKQYKQAIEQREIDAAECKKANAHLQDQINTIMKAQVDHGVEERVHLTMVLADNTKAVDRNTITIEKLAGIIDRTPPIGSPVLPALGRT